MTRDEINRAIKMIRFKRVSYAQRLFFEIFFKGGK